MNNDKHNILLVEDSTDLGYLLSEYLRMKNFKISWFADGESALKNLDTVKYDLAILDITMPEELVIRIENLLSRMVVRTTAGEKATIFKIGRYTFNVINQELMFENEAFHLTTKESELLHYLVVRKNKLCSHKDILIKLWGANDYFNKKSLNVFITRLRKYLEMDDSLSIDNIHGQGFILRQ